MVDPQKWRESWEELEEGFEKLETGLREIRRPRKRISKGRLKLSTRKAKRKAQRIIKRHKTPYIAKRKIEIISRKGQPKATQMIEDIKGGPVASSWISRITWDDGNFAVMSLLNGWVYAVYIPMRIYQEWYWAHSKGTFFNVKIKKQYKVKRLSK